MLKQCTLRNVIHASGVGIHTGAQVLLTLKPAPVNTGVVFVRTDYTPAVSIPARVAFVSETSFCTMLEKDGATVATVEHILSALCGLGIDNVIIELDGPEIPALDGSASPFIFLIQSAGIVTQPAPKSVIRILSPIEVREGDKCARLEPYAGFQVRFDIDFDHPVIQASRQHFVFECNTTTYIKQISRARTFGFLADLEWLRARRLALGASLSNAIVLDDTGVMNKEELRYPDEFVRHKILDAIGDLYLLERPLIGAFHGVKSGHGLNIRLIRALCEAKDAWEWVQVEETMAEEAA